MTNKKLLEDKVAERTLEKGGELCRDGGNHERDRDRRREVDERNFLALPEGRGHGLSAADIAAPLDLLLIGVLIMLFEEGARGDPQQEEEGRRHDEVIRDDLRRKLRIRDIDRAGHGKEVDAAADVGAGQDTGHLGKLGDDAAQREERDDRADNRAD